MDDEKDPDRQLAEDAAHAWFRGLSDRGQAALSDFDLDGLADLLEGALSGELRNACPAAYQRRRSTPTAVPPVDDLVAVIARLSEPVSCPRCDGKGRVLLVPAFCDPMMAMIPGPTMACPGCQGSGILRAPPTTPPEDSRTREEPSGE
jgi:hypothetical protein